MVDTEIATAGQWSSAATEVLLYEFKADLNEYLAASGAPLKSLDELIQFNSRNAAAEMPYFGQELFEQAQAKGSLDEQSYQEALAQVRRLAGAEGVLLALQSQHLDALIAPARTPAWLTDVILSDRSSGTSSYAAAALAGTPSITVPMGESFGLPFGIVFMGSAWSEPRLIGLAYAFEQATKARRAPTFRRTVNPEAVSPQASGSGTLANSVRPAKGRRCTRSQ